MLRCWRPSWAVWGALKGLNPMAVSSPSIPDFALHSADRPSFYEKLNTRWPERALQVFMFIVLAPWGEHLFQAYQI